MKQQIAPFQKTQLHIVLLFSAHIYYMEGKSSTQNAKIR